MRELMSLSGQWSVKLLDGKMSGLKKVVSLPSTLDECGLGDSVETLSTECFSRKVEYYGRAAYQRNIIIPQAWRGRHLNLVLERARVTNVFVDNVEVGSL